MTTTTGEVFSVNLWGSHPDDDNDDCWTGEDYSTRAEAEAVFNDPRPTFDSQSYCSDLDGRGHDVYVELARGTRDGSGSLVDVETIRVRKVDGRKGSYLRDRSDLDEWRREIAREEGMLNGVDSYNDWMGY